MKIRPLFIAAALTAILPAILVAQHADMPGMSPPKTPATLLTGTGSHRHPMATTSPDAQKFFDQGMAMAYGFNHEEAYRSFAKAAELDPKAAMPRWGMALVLGSNYNDPAPVDERLLKARAEVEKALVLSAGGPDNERAYVETLAIRYVADPAGADKPKIASDYAAAMKALSARYPDDLDAATLYADSLMNLTPWKLWSPAGEPGPNTVEIVAVLASVLKRDPNHPGANHFYIHATEASKSPERALPSAKRLETLVPAAGHLVHMPAHVYVRTGDYVAAEKSNTLAAEVDRAYIRETGAQGMYPVMYYNHNVHFESYAATMAGRHAVAKGSADRLFTEVLPVVSMDQMLEGFLLQPAFVAVRFRKWDDVRKMPDPGTKLPLLRAGWLWARAMAAAGSGEIKKAETERAAFAAARAAVPEKSLAGPQNSAAAVLEVAANVLDARIAEAKGDPAAAIASWRKAVEAEDRLAYDEPPGWYYPTRESLGAAFLRSGQAAEAEAIFRADLDIHPRNGRSLFGLSKSLEAQKKTADAAFARAQFDTAWKDADTPVRLEDL
jgi:tetratricopeptide (TPR) repeat protein